VDKALVNGLAVDVWTPKLDCVVCIEAKHSEKPFSGTPNHKTKPGELTHINV
jgi:hypothetical protein